MQVNFCLVGAGRAGMVHGRNLANHIPGAGVRAVVDVDEKRAGEAAEELGAEAHYTDFERALEDGGFDAVCIGAPTFIHRDVIVAAADAGRHVFTEKPLCITMDEARDIREAVERNGIRFQIGFMRRFDRNFLRAKEIIDRGDIGRPTVIKSVGRGPGLPPEWYADIGRSNGLLAEVNSHDFDSMRWLAGSDFKSVFARAANFKCPQYEEKYPEFYDTVTVNLTFEDGTLGLLDGCCPATYGYDGRMEILGTDGLLMVGSKRATSVLVWRPGQELVADGNRSWRVLFREAYLEEDRHFVDCILTGREPKVGLEAGARAVEIVRAANRSIETGEPVEL